MSSKEIPTYTFGSISFKDLEHLVSIRRNISTEVFCDWFEAESQISHDDNVFFEDLIRDNYFLIESYNEEELKVKFISPILNRVKFTNVEHEIRDFYEEKITYKTDKFILTGTTDFLVSKGLEYSKKPYFFIQEFKKTIKNDDPRPQLLAELISAIELNGFKVIKGAFIIGENWNFVILEKQENNKYQYFVSHTLNATHINDLRQIYKNLLFVKHEIINSILSDLK
ncbi:hypothetical protein [Candidatus Parabeggiatoa sp. HSG14]|uniref:hypothetical protein n=1 Tax=Candidatus Parabeggiatoa sp. HSG14 TaxID=3055593 RepID=UPI0025A747F6|nr:hypothetical protein [Thiotrichales bacterium HSG14]